MTKEELRKQWCDRVEEFKASGKTRKRQINAHMCIKIINKTG
ncbi:hypothetical protein [Acetivibrio clariflavus]|nr:hypothetical protein [Acetivibrio clariflavus]